MTSACVAVAYSGGRDSIALLHATAVAAREVPGLSVVALHVHHGLSVHADAWLAHAQATCQDWADQGLPVSLVYREVTLDSGGGESIEALARAARYTALHEMALEAGADLLLLAHHQQDQAETLLLQALRGGGVAGLAGMPRDQVRQGVRWVRPWLDHPRAVIEAYVARHGLNHIDDDSNTDTRLARNRLRLTVWPALLAAFPDAEVNLAASARRVADALPLVAHWHEQAVQALTPHACAPSIAPVRGLDASVWSQWPAAERREALRYWYAQVAGQALPARWVERLADEVPGLVQRQQAVCWVPVGLSLYRGILSWEQASDVHDLPAAPEVVTLEVRALGDWAVPQWGGTLRVTEVTQGGVEAALLSEITLRDRAGGEQFQAGPGRPPRTLKKQFQAAGVPAWKRQGPIVYAGARLLYVPGLGMDARVWAPAGVPQWALMWVREPVSAPICL